MSFQVHLTFAGECEAAFRFYERVLGGHDLYLMRYGDSPAAGDVAPAWRDKVVHANIWLGDKQLAGADVAEGYERPRGFYLLFTAPTRDDAERIFGALADGGAVHMPLQKTFWAPLFGVVTDRFGVPWEITVTAA